MLGTTWLWFIPQVNAHPKPSPGLWDLVMPAPPCSCDASATTSPLVGPLSLVVLVAFLLSGWLSGAQLTPVCLTLELGSHPSRPSVSEPGMG